MSKLMMLLMIMMLSRGDIFLAKRGGLFWYSRFFMGGNKKACECFLAHDTNCFGRGGVRFKLPVVCVFPAKLSISDDKTVIEPESDPMVTIGRDSSGGG